MSWQTSPTARVLAWSGVHRLVRRHWAFAAVCATGVAVRAALIPLWHGQDFTVWRLASTATLRGVNVYAHHPHYPGGPYAYFPLFLYLELPLRWLAQLTPAPFVVLGKLPIALADSAVAVLVYRVLCRARSHPVAAFGAALYFLNPLVLYNSALYGRFDSLGCALLLAFTASRTGQACALTVRQACWYGLAVVAKTFPVLVAAAALRAAGARWRRLVAGTVLVSLLVVVPYLLTPMPLLHDVVAYDASKAPTGLSWWAVLDVAVRGGLIRWISDIGLLVFAVAAVLIARRTHADLTLAVAATLVAFLLGSKLVLEQYLTWPLPWLIILGMSRHGRQAAASLGTVAAFTMLGLLDCESFHPLGRTSVLLGVALAAVNIGFLVAVLRRRPAGPAAAPEGVLHTALADRQPNRGEANRALQRVVKLRSQLG